MNLGVLKLFNKLVGHPGGSQVDICIHLHLSQRSKQNTENLE